MDKNSDGKIVTSPKKGPGKHSIANGKIRSDIFKDASRANRFSKFRPCKPRMKEQACIFAAQAEPSLEESPELKSKFDDIMAIASDMGLKPKEVKFSQQGDKFLFEFPGGTVFTLESGID